MVLGSSPVAINLVINSYFEILKYLKFDFFVVEPKQLKIDYLILDLKGSYSSFNGR